MPQSVNSIYGRNKFGSTYLKKEGKDYKERMIKYIKEEVDKQGWKKVEDRFLYMKGGNDCLKKIDIKTC